MPNIREITKIIKYTPINQAIMLVGVHGSGKSVVITDIFTKEGYTVITLFLGQMEAGDLLGLPDRTEVSFEYNGEIVKQKITEFCPPKWWPRNSDSKVIIFLDEFNRGTNEIYQCIFDMILNRKLNGIDLPKHTRIIAAINPPGDEMNYDVHDIDPALMDRFNVYAFEPDIEEWTSWLVSQHANKHVIGFVSNSNRQQIDPPPATERKMNEVYPSRRSWKRVSDIMNENPDLINNLDLLYSIIMGIVGYSATSHFKKFMTESKKNVSAAAIITNWNNDVLEKVKGLSSQEIGYLNKEMDIYLQSNCTLLFESSSAAKKYAYNIECYLKNIHPELAGSFFHHLSESNNCKEESKRWGKFLLDINPSLSKWWMNIIRGKSDEDKEFDKHINPDIHRKDDEDNDLQKMIDDILN